MTERNQFRLEGEYWSIVYAGELCRLRDCKGLRYISLLLQHPGERIAATTLVDLLEPRRPRPTAARALRATRDTDLARVKVTRAIRAALRRISACSAILIAHFDATLRTGSSCCYALDSRLPVAWDVVVPL